MSSKAKRRSEPYRIQRAILDFDVYGYRVTFIFTNDLQRARNEYDTVIGTSFNTSGTGAFHAACDWQSDPQGYLFFKEKATPTQIAHESYHAIARMFRWAGIYEDTTVCAGEIFAYHLGHLVGNITSAQKKLVRKHVIHRKNQKSRVGDVIQPRLKSPAKGVHLPR